MQKDRKKIKAAALALFLLLSLLLCSGCKQTAKEVETGRVYITSQNHGYAVVSDSMPENGKVSFVNGNDNTCEGVNYTNMPAFSVQFHPEACGGPHDTAFLFDRFIELMKNNRK